MIQLLFAIPESPIGSAYRENNDPVMTVEYKPEEWNPDYDIINNPEEFRLYVDGELVEYE